MNNYYVFLLFFTVFFNGFFDLSVQFVSFAKKIIVCIKCSCIFIFCSTVCACII